MHLATVSQNDVRYICMQIFAGLFSGELVGGGFPQVDLHHAGVGIWHYMYGAQKSMHQHILVSAVSLNLSASAALVIIPS